MSRYWQERKFTKPRGGVDHVTEAVHHYGVAYDAAHAMVSAPAAWMDSLRRRREMAMIYARANAKAANEDRRA